MILLRDVSLARGGIHPGAVVYYKISIRSLLSSNLAEHCPFSLGSPTCCLPPPAEKRVLHLETYDMIELIHGKNRNPD
jgi:hypothetical protein